MRVRDPAKEIYGLLRDRSANGRGPTKPHVYGNVRTHAPVRGEQSYLDVLQQKLFGKNSNNNNNNQEEGEPSYGVVRYQEGNSSPPSQPSPPASSFETVRELLAANDGSAGGSGNGAVSAEEGSSFDLIRERLLNTRAKNQLEQNKSLRRKNSRKRRRNVSLKLILCCNQFHQHFTSSFCANILLSKNTNTNCDYRKASSNFRIHKSCI